MTQNPPRAFQPGHALSLALHRVRVSAFAMGFVILATYMMGKGYGAPIWAALLLQSTIYPHLLRWRLRHASHPIRAEFGNFLIDTFVAGLWAGGLGYPLWIAFTLLACSVVTITLYGGVRGAVWACALFLLGGGALFALVGPEPWPPTDTLTTLLCIVGLLVFLVLSTNTAFLRNRKLQETRAALRQNEQALHQKIAEIDALQAQLHEQANRDPLTGLYNRRYLDGTLERELARCKREGHPLSLMLLDIDHFKSINDTYGHQAGDEVLRRLADLLAHQARAGDVACRYGGEEFLLLLPNMPLAAALERAERWRRSFADGEMAFGELRLRATLSVGIAAYPGHGTEAARLIRQADEALYRAKARGRNRIEVAPG